MLNKQQMAKIALNDCVAMLGKDLVEKHKDLCCCSYTILEDGTLSYCLGMDTKEQPYKMGDETPMEFNAFVIVDPKSGTVTRDYNKSTLPN